MKIFSSTDHRVILNDVMSTRRASGEKLSFSKLAENIGVQKTYVSRVMAGDACWSPDQAYLIADQLGFTSDESEYFGLLVELERSAAEKRRTYLNAKIKELRRENLRSGEVINAAQVAPASSAMSEYFVDPYHSLAHVYLTMPKYQKHTAKLADALGITNEHLQQILARLAELGVIRYDRAHDVVTIIKDSVHTPSGTGFVRAHQQLFRSLAFDRLHRCPPSKKNGFTVVFTGDRTLQETIWAEFLAFLERAEKISKGSNSEDVYYLQFDLFPWRGADA